MATRTKDLRDRCVEEAMAIIGEAGVERLSIREVARRLGVSHQAPYKHFPSSDHLLAEIVRHTYAKFSEHLESRPRSDNPDEDMKSLGIAYFQFAMDHPLHYRLMFGTPLPEPAAHPEMMREARYAFAILLDAIALRNGEASPPPANLTQLDALFVWASLHGLSAVMKTAALDQLGLGKALLSEALPHTLACIGRAITRPIKSAATDTDTHRGKSHQTR